MTPTDIRSIALAMYECFCETEKQNGRHDMPPFPDLNAKEQAMWCEIAKAGVGKMRELGL